MDKPMAKTAYMILASDTAGIWVEKGTVAAAGARAARKEFNDNKEEGAAYSAVVAIPMRSWKPKTTETVTVTRTVEKDLPQAARGSEPVERAAAERLAVLREKGR